MLCTSVSNKTFTREIGSRLSRTYPSTLQNSGTTKRSEPQVLGGWNTSET
eukprot:m.79687 g.79687  ORF g.79687 m.79687 type:complete len:50 (+) comp11985_c0_seq3:711-860(+)